MDTTLFDLIDELNEELNSLQSFFSYDGEGARKDQIDPFLSAHVLYEKIIHELYFAYFVEQQIPEQERVGAVLASLVKVKLLSVEQVTDLFDQSVSAIFLLLPSWSARQPDELQCLKEICSKMPLYHQRMTELVELITADALKASSQEDNL